MAGFEFEKLYLDGAFCISNFSVGDNRGGFTKCFEKDIYKDGGIDFKLNETFATVTAKNVIRGLHFQINNPQAKPLVFTTFNDSVTLTSLTKASFNLCAVLLSVNSFEFKRFANSV